MTLNLSSFLLGLFGLSLMLITLSLFLRRGANPADSTNGMARFFLIALRLAIGWHCFVEGMEKFETPNWSSEAYLRESMGPLSAPYRDLAGDRFIDKLTVGADGAFPAELDREWTGYVNAFTAYYELKSEQIDKVKAALDKSKTATLAAFAKPASVTKITPYPPEIKADWTMTQRLEEHARLLAKVHAVEEKFPTDNKKVLADWKTAKADLAKWRAELKKSLDAETAKMKKAVTDAAGMEGQLRPLWDSKDAPSGSWRLLEISDAIVKWSLVILGSCLLLGLFSRLSSLLTALLVLSFYLAMPPLPGWPESPRLEGHYLLINKTLIEVIALFALAFIPTGRWAGLDALIGLCFSGKAKPSTSPKQ